MSVIPFRVVMYLSGSVHHEKLRSLFIFTALDLK